MIWAFTFRGRFTVNSAYKVTRTITQPPTSVETSQSNEQARFWPHIRNLHIPNKIKNFTWKACNNILPTKANLYHRQVIDDPTCEARTLEPETVGHLFWECNVAKELWTLSDVPLERTGIIHRSFMDLIWYLLFKQHMDTRLIELVVTIAWSAWFNRNKTCLGEARQTP